MAGPEDGPTALSLDPSTHTALLTPDAEMPRPVAVVAANWRLDADGVDPEAIRAFVLAHRDQAPETICGGGTRP